MTREERLDWLCRLRSDISYMDFSIDINVSLERKRQYRQALSEVIKALEQEAIINKIEEEINSPNRGTCDYFIVDRIEEIINKYKAESEDKE